MALRSSGVAEDNPTRKRYEGKVDQVFSFTNRRLGEATYLAGDELTVADIMAVFSLATMRKFYKLDETKYSNITAYLQRIAKLDSYQRAMKKGDPDLVIEDLISPKGPELIEAMRKPGGISSK